MSDKIIEKEEEIIKKAFEFAKEIFKNESSGHDFWHTVRVYNNAILIASGEECNKFIVKLASLLHDVDDQKIFGGNVGQFDNAKKFMIYNNVNEYEIREVCNIINKISFKGTDTESIKSIEGKIVQDADRLDAIGAIGIARTFAFGGAKNRVMHDPQEVAKTDMNSEQYKNNKGTTINHFYEKLLKLKDLMNTDTAKKIAAKRNIFMEEYLKQFLDEWNGFK